MQAEEFFPGVTLDDLADVATARLLPSVAGGSPGVFSDIGLVFSATKSIVFDPIASFLYQKVNATTRRVVEGVAGFASIAGWWIYKYTDAALKVDTALWWRSRFPHPDILKGLSPWYYTHKIMRMVRESVVRRVRAWALWIDGRLNAARSYIEGRLSAWSGWVRNHIVAARNYLKSIVDWYANWVVGKLAGVRDYLYDRVTALANWVRDRIGDARVYIEGRLQAWSGWVRQRIINMGNIVIDALRSTLYWLRDRVNEARDFVAAKFSASFSFLWNRLSAGFDAVTSTIGNVVMAGGQAIGDALQSGFEWLIGNAFEPFLDVVKFKLTIPGKLVRGEYTSLAELVDDAMDPPDDMLKGFAGILMMPFIMAGLMTNLIFGMSGPLIEPVLQEQRKSVGAEPPPVNDMRTLVNRGEMPEATAIEWLRRLGFAEPEAAWELGLRRQLPSPTDLVRFAVREVFSPDIVTQFGLFDEFPAAFSDELELQGFEPERAQQYWGAHWDLPSIQQGFEMFHRGVIDQTKLELLLRVKDVMPFWRQPLIDVAFNRLTRVDLRRLLKAGVIDEARVLQGYLDLGNQPEDAAALTAFAVEWSTPDDVSEVDEVRDLTQAQIRLAYRRGVIDRVDAFERLVVIGFTEARAELLLAVDDVKLALGPGDDADVDVRELTRSLILRAYRDGIWNSTRAATELTATGYLPLTAELLIRLEDVAINRDALDAAIGAIRQGFIGFDLDFVAALTQLGRLGLGSPRIQALMAEWQIDRLAGTRKLSVGQLGRMLGDGLIDANRALSGYLRIGYNADDAALLLADAQA